MQGNYQLVIGGARSGKSRLAEQRALATGQSCIYLATATAGDGEMSARIAHHQARRGDQWSLVEEPLNLAQTLLAQCRPEGCIVVDCLTLWLSNCLHRQCWEEQKAKLIEVLPALPGDIIFVSNEVGTGIVPMGELSRRFVDESGFLHQQLAQICQRVTLVTAGLPQELK